MQSTSLAKALLFLGVTWVVGLTMGCGLDVDIEGDPDPAMVGFPLKYTIDVTFSDSGTAENVALLLLLFSGQQLGCENFDGVGPGDFISGEVTLASIEAAVPEEAMAALPAGVTLEMLAARMNGAVQAASSESQAMCEDLTGDLGDFDGFSFGLLQCLLGDIPSGQTETVMAEVTPRKPGLLTALAIAVSCKQEEDDDDAHEGTGEGFDDDDDGELLLCPGGSLELSGFGCSEINVQGAFAAPVVSNVGMAVLTILLAGLGAGALGAARTRGQPRSRRC